ncbi:hypothetical protein, partial [Glaesserella parasuis]|uniref:hypothetical protein n=1 Tax=Glaesserella parasuis TaxID=738 RepID=UPI0024369826
KLLKSKKERRTVKFKHFTTAHRCVAHIIEKFKTNASTFLQKNLKKCPLVQNKLIMFISKTEVVYIFIDIFTKYHTNMLLDNKKD